MTDTASQYLTSKGVKCARGHGQEVVIHCITCPDGDPKGKGKMYVNDELWLYDCKRCGTRGNRKTLMRHFGDEDKTTFLPGLDPAMRRKVLSEATDIAAEMLENNPTVMAYLKDRGLSLQTIVDARLGYVPAAWPMSSQLRETNKNPDIIASGLMSKEGRDFLLDQIILPYLNHGDVVQVRGKKIDGKYLTLPDDDVRLFNADRLAGADDVIITEGEFDCLVLQQELELADDPKLRATACVGLAGADALPVGFLSYFETARRVYIALDPDDVGKKAALRIKELLGSKARIVNLPADLPKCDWTELFSRRHGTWREVATMLAAADAEGRRLWTIGDSERSWRYVEDEVGGIKVGIDLLDQWISPGIKPGQIMIPLAKTGVGKTNFLCNVAWYTRDRPVLYITLEMTRAEIYDRLRKICHFWDPTATDAQIREHYRLLRIVDQNRLKEGDLARLCDEYEEEVGIRPQLSFVDYLGYFAKGMKGNGPYEKTTNACMSLKEDAKAAFVGLITPHQVNRSADDGKPLEIDDARDSGAVEETADFLMSLYAPEAAMRAPNDTRSLNSTVRYGLMKNRNGRPGGNASLAFSYASLALVPHDSKHAATVATENSILARGDKYEDVLRHRRGQAYGVQQMKLVG